MSNKMLWKRLLAAGMSIALSATLFATNSISTFAAEDVPGETEIVSEEQDGGDGESKAPEIAETGGDPTTWAPEEPTTPLEVAENIVNNEEKPETINTVNEDGSIDRSIVVIETEKIYYSDMYSQDDEGNQIDEYKEVEREDIGEDQKCDFVDVEEIKTEGDVKVYLEDGENNPVTVKNCKGQDVVLELPEDFSPEQITEVQVIETDYYTRELNPWTEEPYIFYGRIDDTTGKFERMNEGDEGAQAYIFSSLSWETTDQIYSTVDLSGKRVFIDKQTYLALSGQESNYTVVKEYTYQGESYTEDQLKEMAEKKEATIQIKDKPDDWKWEATIQEKDDKIEEHFFTKEWSCFGPPTMVEKPVTVIFTGYDVKEEIKGPGYHGKQYVIEYSFIVPDKKGEYKVTRTVKSNEVPGIKVDEPVKFVHGVLGTVDSKNETVTTTVPGKKTNYDFSIVSVYDENNNLVFQGDRRAYDRIISADVTQLEDKVRVDIDWYNHIYLDDDDYTVIREHEDKLSVTESFYFTVQEKDKDNAKEIPFTLEGNDYKLNLEFWENSRIAVSHVEIVPKGDGKADLIIDYKYSSFDGMDEEDLPATQYKKEISANDFNSQGEATLTLKYLPVYFTRAGKEEIQEPIYIIPVGPMFRSVMLRTGLYDEAVFAEIARDIKEETGEEFFFDTEVDELGGREIDEHRMLLVKESEDWDKSEPEPQPNPNPEPGPNPDVTPDAPTGTEEIPYFLTTLAAAPGQVLGAQRVEPVAGEAPAVLGASRARGTADETTAPFVRVLVMAAVASAALFLTRKREEKN